MTEISDTKPAAFRVSWQYFVSILLIIMAGSYMKFFMVDEIAIERPLLDHFPQQVAEWRMAGLQSLAPDILDTLKVDDYLMRDYSDRNGLVLSLYIGYYKTHRRSAEIHTPEHCQAGSGWEILNERKRDMPSGDGKRGIHFVEAVYEKNKEKMIFIYWYNVNGKYITSFFEYKLSVIFNSLFNHRSDATFTRIAVPVSDNNINDASKAGEGFLIDVIPALEAYFSDSRTIS